ncbi:serine hydrolase [bacterium]|nr:serine hydrolase [bacterium]
MNRQILTQLRQLPGEIAAYYQDLHTGRSWGWNADADFPAASVIKVPILLAVLQAAQHGRLSLDQKIQVEFKHHVGGAGVLFELHDGIELTVLDLCRMMIVVSDNVASNLLLDLLPPEAMAEFFAQHSMHRSLLGRRFMEQARPGHDNRTTAYDMGICLAALARGELLDRSHTNQALSTMRRQQFREKIPLMLPPELPVAHKTGELEGVRHDCGIIEVHERPYVLVLLTQKGGASWDVDRALAELSLAVYDWHLGDL